MTRPSSSQRIRTVGMTLGSQTLVEEERTTLEETSLVLGTRCQVEKVLGSLEEEMEVLETCSLVLVGEKQAQLTSWLQLRVIPAEAIIFNEPLRS